MIAEGPNYRIAGGTTFIGGDGVEQAAPDDLKALIATGGTPFVGNAVDHIAQTIESLFAIAAAYFIGALGNGDQQQHIGHLLGRFCERLREGHLGIKGAGGQVGIADQVAGIGHPFIHQDETGGSGAEQRGQILSTRSNALLIAVGDAGIAFRAT